jgi:amino acid transporter
MFVATSAVTIGTSALSPMLSYFGALYNNPALTNLATEITTPVPVVISGVVIILLGAVAVMFTTNFYFKIQNYLLVAVFVSFFAFLIVLLPLSQTSFAASFNAFAANYMGKPGDYYHSVISTATTDGWANPGTTSLYGGLLCYPIVAGAGLYGPLGAQISGELRNPKKSYLLGMLLASAFALIYWGSILALMYNSMGFNFISAIDYLLYNNPSQIPLPSLPYAGFLTALATSPTLAMVIFVVGIIQFFMFLPSAYLYMSRALFAYSFDRVIPEWFSKISDRTNGPLNAIAASVIISSILFVIVNIPQSASYVFLFGSVANMYFQFFPVLLMALIAIIVVIRKGQSYEGLPIKGWKLAGLGVALIFCSMSCAYLLLTVAIYGANTPIGLELLVGGTAVFVLIYVIAWARKRDTLALVFKQIPPE